MRATFFFLLLFSLNVFALDEFGVEKSFSHQVPIPASVIVDLKIKIDLEGCGFTEKNYSEALEATKVQLNEATSAILVKPKSWCLCGAYYCPIWLYQINNNNAKRIWSTSGTSGLEILDKKSHGYRQIKVGGGTAGHSFEQIWAWDGSKYKLTKEKYSTAGEEKK